MWEIHFFAVVVLQALCRYRRDEENDYQCHFEVFTLFQNLRMLYMRWSGRCVQRRWLLHDFFSFSTQLQLVWNHKVCCHGEGELRIYLFSHQGIADLLILPEVRALTSNERNTLLKSQEGVLLVIMFVNICSQSAQKANWKCFSYMFTNRVDLSTKTCLICCSGGINY